MASFLLVPLKTSPSIVFSSDRTWSFASSWSWASKGPSAWLCNSTGWLPRRTVRPVSHTCSSCTGKCWRKREQHSAWGCEKKKETALGLHWKPRFRNILSNLRYKSKICLISLSHCAKGFGIGPAEILDSLTWPRYRAHCPKRLQFPCLCSNEGITSRSDPAASRNFPARVGPKSRQSSRTTKRRFLRIRHCQHQALHEIVQEACDETNALLSSAWDKFWYVTL